MDIVLFVAMEEEEQAFLELFDFARRSFHDTVYYEAEIGAHTLRMFRTKIGKVHAAQALTRVACSFDVDVFMSVGIAGGVHAPLGGIVLARGAFYHDVDVPPFGYAPGQIPGHDTVFLSDETHLASMKRTLDTLAYRYTVGLIATGDQFLTDDVPLRPFYERYQDIAAVDMESAAIAHTATLHDASFLAVRGISDILGEADQLDDHEQRVVRALNSVTEAVSHWVGHL